MRVGLPAGNHRVTTRKFLGRLRTVLLRNNLERKKYLLLTSQIERDKEMVRKVSNFQIGLLSEKSLFMFQTKARLMAVMNIFDRYRFGPITKPYRRISKTKISHVEQKNRLALTFYKRILDSIICG